MRIRLASIALSALMARAAAAAAGQPAARIPQPRIVAALPVSAYSPHTADRAVAQETWDYVFWFPSGHRLLAQFQITDAGPGSRTGLVAGLVIAPDRRTWLFKNSRPRGQWQSAIQGADVRLSLVRHVFEIGPSRHHVHVEGGGEQFDVEAQPVASPVMLGPVAYARGERYDLTLTAPRLRARATVHVEGMPPLTLTDGWGVALHAASTLPEQDQALSVLRVHTFDQAAQLSVFAFAPPRQRGPEQVGWMVEFRDGRVGVTPITRREYGDFVKESEEPRYSSPRSLRVVGEPPNAVDATLRLSLAARLDVISWINSGIGRFLARRVFHPIQYVFDAQYEMRAPSGAAPVTGTNGIAQLWILNQPKGASWP